VTKSRCSTSHDGLYTGVTRQVLLPSALTSLSAHEVTDSTTSCFLGLYAYPATDGDCGALFLTVNFPLITPGTPASFPAGYKGIRSPFAERRKFNFDVGRPEAAQKIGAIGPCMWAVGSVRHSVEFEASGRLSRHERKQGRCQVNLPTCPTSVARVILAG
jgi:hypothetical protein